MDDRREERARGYRGAEAGVGAVFEVARVGGGSGGRTSRYGIALGLIVGAFIALVVLDGPGRDGLPDTALAGPTPRFEPRPLGTAVPVVASNLVIHSRASGGYVIVHGDVLTLDAEIVVVSIRDRENRIVGVQTVDMPKGSTAFRTGANDRFQIAFDLGDDTAVTVAYVQANAYDRTGRQIATDRQSLYPASDPGWWRIKLD